MDVQNEFTRREALGLATGVSAAWAAGALAAPGTKPPRPTNTRSPRNIIFMVSDGMSMGVPSLAEPFSQLVRQRGTAWHRLLQRRDIAHGFFQTSSLSSMVTDSAAASTAWASGARVFNGALNVLPDGRRLRPIGHLAREAGRRIGLVTTTTMTHATPAGFASVQPNRADQDEIAPQYLDVVDVLMGGGHEFFAPERRSDGRDVIAEYRDAGYAYWNRREQVKSGKAPRRILGLFHDGHLPYTIDHRNRTSIAAQVPTLAEMTLAALGVLGDTEHGFLLQVEGGRIDHAAHANDAAAMLWDQLAFDDAVAVALKFASGRDDTLVIITSDHGNANPGLNGMGSAYSSSAQCFERLAGATISYEALHSDIQRDGVPQSDNDFAAWIHKSFGLDLDTHEHRVLQEALAGNLPSELNKQHANLVGTLGQVLGNHTGIGWTGVTHTNDLVLLTALGPGCEHFAGLLQNTDAFERLTRLMGIRHQNPSMSPEEAQQYLAQAPTVETVHWA